MTSQQCAQHIQQHPDLELIGFTSDSLQLRNVEQDVPIELDFTKLPDDVRWEELEPVLLFTRRPDCMNHYARIVGYYQNLRNAQPSRVREIRDRTKY